MKEKRGTKLGLAAFGTAVVITVTWFAVNRRVGIPEDRTFFVIGFLVAVALGIAAFVRGTRWYGGLAAALAILTGTFLPLTIAVSPQAVGSGAIHVGDTIPHFEAVDEFGKRFDSESLHGHLVLIKFFRAHW
jgi:hypothetical protein